MKGAEECYGRAILASPGDGELLMLYGMLVWENYREKERAGAYLQKATELSPHDWYVHRSPTFDAFISILILFQQERGKLIEH